MLCCAVHVLCGCRATGLALLLRCGLAASTNLLGMQALCLTKASCPGVPPAAAGDPRGLEGDVPAIWTDGSLQGRPAVSPLTPISAAATEGELSSSRWGGVEWGEPAIDARELADRNSTSPQAASCSAQQVHHPAAPCCALCRSDGGVLAAGASGRLARCQTSSYSTKDAITLEDLQVKLETYLWLARL